MITQCINKMFQEGRITQAVKEDLEHHIGSGSNLDEAINKTKSKFSKSSAERVKAFEELKTKFNKETPELSADKQIQVRLSPLAGKGSKATNVESQAKSYMQDILSKYHSTIAPLRNKLFNSPLKKVHLQDAVKTVFDGVKRSKEGDEIAGMITTVQKEMDTRLGREPSRNLVNHDVESIQNISKQEYVDNTSQLTSNSKEELGQIYDDVTNGNSDAAALQYNNADDLLIYAGKYGSDVWTSFLNNIEKDTRNLAINDIFGSKQNLSKMINNLSKEGRNKAENILSELDGSVNHVVKKNLATTISKMARQITSLAMLPNAVLSAISDIATILATAYHDGLPMIKTSIDIAKALFNNKANEEFLAKQGMIADNLISDLMGASRYDQYAGTDALSIANDKMFKITGLTHWTNSMKNMWKRSYIEHLQTLPKQFSNIKGKNKELLDAYGITSKDWREYKNGTTTHKIRRMINEESNYAVVEPNANILSIMHQGTRQGTLKGETLRHLGQFKSFAVATYMTHIYRALGIGTIKDRLSYATALFAFSLPVGALVTALKDASKGNDPTTRDYTKPKTLVDVITNSGFGGPAIEMIASSFGKGKVDVASMIAAPSFSIMNNIALKPAHYWIKHPSDFRDVFNVELQGLAKEIPGNSSWMAQLTVNKLARYLLLTVDPEYQKVIRKSDKWKKKNRKETGLQPFEL